MTLQHPPNFQHTTWNTPGPWNTPCWNTPWNETALERQYFIGTGYRTLLDADQQTIAVCGEDVATFSSGYMNDREPVVCLHSPTGSLLAALPWPEGTHDDAAAVRWALRLLREQRAW